MNEAPESAGRAQRFAFCLFDMANSAFPTVIITAVYVVYFKAVVVGHGEPGYSDWLWGLANSVAAGVVFLLAPILGAIADQSGRKQHFMAGFTLLCVVATGLLVLTGPGTVLLATVLFILAVVGFEAACVFYNAFLPEIALAGRMERLSGTAWATGYIGGLGSLLLCLPLAKTNPRYVPLVVAAWFLLLSIPSLLLLRDRTRPVPTAGAPSFTRLGVAQLVDTLRSLKRHRELIKFLLAFFFFDNAVMTIIVFAVAFSKDTLSFSLSENILLIVVMNVVAAPGAFVFGRVAEKLGAKRTIIITLVGWLVVVAGAEVAAWPALLTASQAKQCFWGVASLASLCIGVVQSTSRTFVGQLAPADQSAEFFGFMAFAGKGSAILGPMVFGAVSALFHSQRAAVLSTGMFFLIGLGLITRVQSPRQSPGPAPAID